MFNFLVHFRYSFFLHFKIQRSKKKLRDRGKFFFRWRMYVIKRSTEVHNYKLETVLLVVVQATKKIKQRSNNSKKNFLLFKKGFKRGNMITTNRGRPQLNRNLLTLRDVQKHHLYRIESHH